MRDGVPVLAIDQADATAWTSHASASFPLMDLYKQSRRHILTTALEVLRRVDNTA